MKKNKGYSVWAKIDFPDAFELKAVIKRVERDFQRLGYKYTILKSLMKDFYPKEKF